ISVVGLPNGVSGAVTVTGPGNTNKLITSTTTLSNLQPGNYSLNIAPVAVGSTQYTASPATKVASVTRGNTTTSTVSYGGQSTSLTIDFSGLPGGSSPITQVTGPNGFSRAVTAATVL